MVVDEHHRHHLALTSMPDSLAAAAMLQGQGSVGPLYSSEPWSQRSDNAQSDDEDLGKIDRALAMEVNIPLDHKGELVMFREVRLWKLPTLQDLEYLKTRINDEWIKPLNLKQQDIVKASGLGAPYVCYLLKDPNSPNMNRRRKIEAYSVLTELFRKFDSGTVTREDFIRLRNQRVANRFQGPRQTSGTRGIGKAIQRRRRRRLDQDENGFDDDDGSQDDDINDPTGRNRRKRARIYNSQQIPYYSPDPTTAMYGAPQMKAMGFYPAMSMGMGMGFPQGAAMPMQAAPAAPTAYPAMMGGYINGGTTFPLPGYDPQGARGRTLNPDGTISAIPEGQTFQAPYPSGFPPVMRTITSIPPPETADTLVDGPPSVSLAMDKVNVTLRGMPLDKRHSEWIREKVTELSRNVIVPRTSPPQPDAMGVMQPSHTSFRDPVSQYFIFLLDQDSCLLPIGVKLSDTPVTSTATKEDLWDIKALRRDAEQNDWLSENRDWDDSLWVLWDIKESGSAVHALFEKWHADHHLGPEDMYKVKKCFLSQFTYLRDVELSFQALLPYAQPDEDFFRNVEINCDLLEEQVRVKDAFVWDIRASDWDLAALLSNFVSDFQLESPAISSLFIDLKTTVLRYRKEWVSRMLERLTVERRLDPANVLPATLGLEEQTSRM